MIQSLSPYATPIWVNLMNESYLSNRPCPVCGEHEGSALAQLCYALFDDLKMSGHKTLLQCNTCGMLYDDIHFSNNQLQEYYSRNEHYAVSNTGGSGSVSQDNKERYRFVLDCWRERISIARTHMKKQKYLL